MIVFVTGASSGFGRAIATRFAQEKHQVIACARRLDKLESLAQAHPSFIHPLAFDVRDKEATQSAIESLPYALRAVDILVNNAGLALGMEAAPKASFSDWEIMVDTNIKGLLHCTFPILKMMNERNQGHIINMGSVAGEFPYPGGNVYGATKSFVHQFSLNLRADLLGTRIRVTCIEPGISSGTEFSEVRFKGDATKAGQVYKGVQALTAEDIADSVYWVASRPAHVNINLISLMPTQQAFSALAVARNEEPKGL